MRNLDAFWSGIAWGIALTIVIVIFIVFASSYITLKPQTFSPVEFQAEGRIVGLKEGLARDGSSYSSRLVNTTWITVKVENATQGDRKLTRDSQWSDGMKGDLVEFKIQSSQLSFKPAKGDIVKLTGRLTDPDWETYVIIELDSYTLISIQRERN